MPKVELGVAVAAGVGTAACVALGRSLLRRRGGATRWPQQGLRWLTHHQTPPPVSVVNDAVTWEARCSLKRSGSEGYFAYYSSVADAVTTNVSLMSIPIDDHAVVRGHAVFDTCTLTNASLYRLSIHLDRLFASARSARVPLPFGETEDENRAKMTEIIRATCLASGKDSADVRFWLTSGTGNLGVTPKGCQSQFYVLVFGGLPGEPTDQGVAEVTVSDREVPLKPTLLAELKSNNYMLNCLQMLKAQDKGGLFGIGVDQDGYLLESCVLNVVAVGEDGVLRTPPFSRVLRGTTVRRAIELAKGAGLTVQQVPLTVDDAYASKELFLLAGDLHAIPIVSLDSRPVGDGLPGPVFKQILNLLQEDANLPASNNHTPLVPP